MGDQSCPICEQTCEKYDLGPFERIKCERCGNFEVTEEFALFRPEKPFREQKKIYLIQGLLRERSDQGLKTKLFTQNPTKEINDAFTLEDLLSFGGIPESPDEKLMLLLRKIKERTGVKFGQKIKIYHKSDYPIAYAVDTDELVELLETLHDLGLVMIEKDGIDRYLVKLLIDGWRKLEQVSVDQPDSKQAFIAMWFSGYNPERDLQRYEPITKEERDACFSSIALSFKDTSFSPVRVDRIEHNDKICDKIIAEIKKSRFVVADVTGNRGGVYFEAGFAKALGLEVIWLCHVDHKEDMHFDTDHFNHIIYANHEELTEKLHSRILGSIF